MRSFCALTALAVLCGCAAPNTPGAGAGATYTPIVDMEGVDPNRYMADLNACRSYSNSIRAGDHAVAGALAGAVTLGVLSAAFGGRRNENNRWAAAGAVKGASLAGRRAMDTQERVIINCMAGRGYRTLDAAIVLPSPDAPSPYARTQSPASPYGPVQPSAFPVALPVNVPEASADQPGGTLSTAPAQQPAATPFVVASNSPFSLTTPMGTAGAVAGAERLAKDHRCNETPHATLFSKNRYSELYTVPCSNGTLMAVRCEFSNCLLLQ